ncbi:MAG TPA: response regulator [Thermoguttaceae bacterium]|nr:response regulator [Thermoguttaceae bacterium]HPP52607.1 response regulator [Thermoguttaceae bacterium]
MKFLVVDDDKFFRIFLQKVLSQFGVCHTAYDGGEGLNAFRIALEDGDPYDYLFVDIMMPQMNGHQMLETIRTMERNRGIMGGDGVKIVITTGKEDAEECIRAFREGCEYFLVKPIQPADVLECLRELNAPV